VDQFPTSLGDIGSSIHRFLWRAGQDKTPNTYVIEIHL